MPNPYESTIKPIKQVSSKQVKRMSEDTHVHQMLKVIHINSVVDQMQKTIKSLNKQKRRILDKISTEPGSDQSPRNK